MRSNFWSLVDLKFFAGMPVFSRAFEQAGTSTPLGLPQGPPQQFSGMTAASVPGILRQHQGAMKRMLDRIELLETEIAELKNGGEA